MLTPGKLLKEMIVTVLENKPYESEKESLCGNTVQKIKNFDQSGYGKVLKIIVVQLPYVIVNEFNNGKLDKYPFTYDTRRTTFMELNEEYLIANGIEIKTNL